MTGEFMTTAEAAEFLGCSQRQVQKLCQRGVLKSHRVGGDLRIAKAELIRYRGKAAVGSVEAMLSAASAGGASISNWSAVLAAFRVFREVHPVMWLEDAPELHRWHQELIDTCSRLEQGEDVNSDGLLLNMPKEIRKILKAAE